MTQLHFKMYLKSFFFSCEHFATVVNFGLQLKFFKLLDLDPHFVAGSGFRGKFRTGV